MGETRTCPICKNPVVVRVGIVEKHAKDRRATFAAGHGRPAPVEWCEAGNTRWDDLEKR